MVYRVYAKNKKPKKWYQEDNWYGAAMIAILDWLDNVTGGNKQKR